MLNIPKTPPPTNKKKFSRTSVIGWLIMLIILLAFFLVYNKTISIRDYGSFVSVCIGLLASVGFIFSKDEK